VQFPAADPEYESVLALAPDEFVSLAYVYLSLDDVTAVDPLNPKANIPLVLFPAADPEQLF